MGKIYGIGGEEELAEDLQKKLPNRIIEELEKIKEEMKEERDSYDLSCKNTFNVCIELMDKHIEELKGE